MINVEQELDVLLPKHWRNNMVDVGMDVRLSRVLNLLRHVAAERDEALFALRAMERNLTNATNNYCECGGRGPGDGCQACETYHWVMGTANPTKGE